MHFVLLLRSLIHLRVLLMGDILLHFRVFGQLGIALAHLMVGLGIGGGVSIKDNGTTIISSHGCSAILGSMNGTAEVFAA